MASSQSSTIAPVVPNGEDDGFNQLVKLVLEIQFAFGITSNDDTSNTVAGAPTTSNEKTAANSNLNNGSDPVTSPAGAATTTTPGNEITEADSSIDNGSVPAAIVTAPATTIGNANSTNRGVADPPAPAKSDAEKNDERREKKLLMDVKHIRKNVEYIKNNVDSLKTSPNRDEAEELLQFLMDVAKNQSTYEFPKKSENLNHLLHIVAKLKHWVPPQRVVVSDESKMKKSNKKKKESPFVSKTDKENAAAEIVKELVSYDCKDWGMDGLLKSYGELKVRDKLCLLCFSVFPCDVGKDGESEVLVQKNLVIKKKILIFWWVGEGFIDPPPPPVKVPSPNQNSTLNTDPLLNLDPNQNQNPQQGNVEDERETIESIGVEILNVLRNKGFIEPVMKRGRESGSYQMHPFVHSFVTALAKKAGFFDFCDLDGKLTLEFALSQRACLLKSQGKSLSSCRKWMEDIDKRELKKFKTVQTLFNVDESIIDIKPEWFSKMKYLSVLHLGSWRSEAGEHIEVEDPKFMEEFKTMKQLKLFSLQGVATIMKLPDSVCKLSNLIILDLRECHNLEELPAKIGSMKNLTHLDITNCHLLTKLPIGISLLSKLEVLNGFVIYNQDGLKEDEKGCFLGGWWKKSKGFVVYDLFRRENKEVCTLRDLLKLGSLRELSIVVNRDAFPNIEEVEVLMQMRELCSLKISWLNEFKDDKNEPEEPPSETQDANPISAGGSFKDKNEPEEPPSKCGWCFPGKKTETKTQDANRISAGGSFNKLVKLELLCFPGVTAPDWLKPDKLQKLKKLYIKGGKLKSLGEDENRWNVETLRLKYMQELEIEWRKLRAMFPEMKYLEKYECKKLGLFPCDHVGVWRNKEKIVA